MVGLGVLEDQLLTLCIFEEAMTSLTVPILLTAPVQNQHFLQDPAQKSLPS